MSEDAAGHRAIDSVGVVGAGAMGRGIAQLAAVTGAQVLLFDLDADAAGAARTAIGAMFERLQAKGKMSTEAARLALARIRVATTLEALAPADLVIEAIVERLDAKQGLFRQLGAVVAEECLLASNTSSLSITEIAASVEQPERCLGLHFFNPPPLMRLVEVVPGLRTAPSAIAAATHFVERIGHAPVQASDTPGFLVNHLGRGYVTEAFRMLEEQVAPVETIDLLLKEGAGFRMGPFELMDLTGLDVTHPATEAIYRGFYDEPRFRPSYIARQRIAGGLLGRKTDAGFRTGRAADEAPQECAALPDRVCIVGNDSDGGSRLRAALEAGGVAVLPSETMTDADLVFAVCLGHDATSAAMSFELDPGKTLLVDLLPLKPSRVALSPTLKTSRDAIARGRGALKRAGLSASVIQESAGLVVQRTLSTIINIACDAAQRGIAAPEDIDRALVLALGYPRGPLAWADEIGPGRVLETLEVMHARTGDARYRPSLFLRRRVEIGLPLVGPSPTPLH